MCVLLIEMEIIGGGGGVLDPPAQKYSVDLQEIFVSRLCSQEENVFPALILNLSRNMHACITLQPIS